MEAELYFNPNVGRGSLVYRINNIFYNPSTGRAISTPNNLEDYNLIMTIYPDTDFESEPMFIRTSTGWAIVTNPVYNDVIAKVISSPDVMNQPLTNTVFFNIPDFEQVTPKRFKQKHIREFSGHADYLVSHFAHDPLNKYIIDQTSTTLSVNGIKVPFVSLEEINSMLQSDQIHNYVIDPLLQAWAGPTGTLNRIITFFTRNGQTFLVKARWDPVSQQIFPPV